MHSRTPLLWIIFAILVVASGILLLRGCGLFPALGWDFCPRESAPYLREVERGAELQAEAAALKREVASHQLTCLAEAAREMPPLTLPEQAGPAQPQQTATKAPVDLPVDRWQARDLGVLEGCWVLGRNAAVSRTDMRTGRLLDRCTAVAGRLCFDRNGNGSYQQRTVCPVEPSVTCTAPLKARFLDSGLLRAIQSQVQCVGANVVWMPHTLTCRRIDDTTAICTTRSDKTGESTDLEFRRSR
jgi:hypothetical protein